MISKENKKINYFHRKNKTKLLILFSNDIWTLDSGHWSLSRQLQITKNTDMILFLQELTNAICAAFKKNLSIQFLAW